MALTDRFIKNAKPTGKRTGDKHADGGGMYLLVKPSGKYWRMDYRHEGKRKTMALGVYDMVSLAKARELRDAARKLLASGTDPGKAKRDNKQVQSLAAGNTFESVARLWLEKISPSRAVTTNKKVQAWLDNDVFPYIGKMPISNIKPRDVLTAVQIVEARGAIDSSHRILQVCGQVFRFAVSHDVVERDVTSDLKGALSPVVTTHFPAITEPKAVGALMRDIYNYEGHAPTRAALKLAPMLFVRPGELRTAEWTEFDLDIAEWRIPAGKMKMKIEHVVPLPTQAMAILRALHQSTGHLKYVFPGLRTENVCMSENTVNAALRYMGYDQETVTGHGFRATARTIMDEVLDERVDLIDHQQAHKVKDVNGTAYNRTKHLPARRALMQRWADYLDQLRLGADVIQLHGGAA